MSDDETFTAKIMSLMSNFFNLSFTCIVCELAFIRLGAISSGMATRFSVPGPISNATTTVTACNKDGVENGHDHGHEGNEVKYGAQWHASKSHAVEGAGGKCI